MEINPFEARLRMLQQWDGVRMQREAAPDAETAGCPGCPYFWTCPVPHRGEEVRAPEEIEPEDVAEELGPRRAFTPRDETDIGWTDVWVDEHGLPLTPEERDLPAQDEAGPAPDPEPAPEPDSEPASPLSPPSPHSPAPRRGWRGLLRRRR